MIDGTVGRNYSDLVLYSSGGRIDYSSIDAGENTTDMVVTAPQASDDASSTNVARAQKIDTSVFVVNRCVGVLFTPGNRLKLGIWQVTGGNSETKITSLISG